MEAYEVRNGREGRGMGAVKSRREEDPEGKESVEGNMR